MKTMKKFDCVKMKDEAQRRRAQTLRGLSPEERLTFYRQADKALRERREQLRQRGAHPGAPDTA